MQSAAKTLLLTSNSASLVSQKKKKVLTRLLMHIDFTWENLNEYILTSVVRRLYLYFINVRRLLLFLRACLVRLFKQQSTYFYNTFLSIYIFTIIKQHY